MPDDNPGGETPPQTPPAATGGTPAPETGADGQPFDATRAQRTIDTLRDEVKAGKAAATELRAAQARLKELDDANKTETERATAKATEAEQALAASQGRLRSMAIRVAVAESASAAGIAPENVKAAIRLLDASTVELDDDGEPRNVEAVLKALVKDFPILAAQAAGGTATRSTPTTPRPGTPPGRDERVKATRESLQANPRYAM